MGAAHKLLGFSEPAGTFNGWPHVGIYPRLFPWLGPGQIYVKILPGGEPVQLTHDDQLKMSPTFSPDGSRMAYTGVDNEFHWDTWVIPNFGGEPEVLLRNAATQRFYRSAFILPDDHNSRS